jgi:hypothetical protein
MNKRSLIALIFGILLTSGSIASAATPTTAPAAVLEIKDLLAISSKKELVQLTLVKIEALARLLSRVTDEASARDLRPAIERSYLEMELVGTRLGMMGPPTAEDRAQVADTQQRYTLAMQTVQREIARIAVNKSTAPTLKSVTWPLHGEIAQAMEAKVNLLVSQLQTLRSQIELYKLQHLDNMPDFRKHGWGQLTSRTDAKGATGQTAPFGPYLNDPPRNPLTGGSKILLVKAKPRSDFHYDQGDGGFIIEESTGRVWGLNAQGKLFDESAAMSSAGF